MYISYFVEIISDKIITSPGSWWLPVDIWEAENNNGIIIENIFIFYIFNVYLHIFFTKPPFAFISLLGTRRWIIFGPLWYKYTILDCDHGNKLICLHRQSKIIYSNLWNFLQSRAIQPCLVYFYVIHCIISVPVWRS